MAKWIIDRADAVTMQRENDELHAKIAKLRAALEPFARNVNALSLSKALGHIEREHLLAARKALAEEGCATIASTNQQ